METRRNVPFLSRKKESTQSPDNITDNYQQCFINQ